MVVSPASIGSSGPSNTVWQPKLVLDAWRQAANGTVNNLPFIPAI